MTPHPQQKDKYYLISESEINKIYRILKKNSFYEEIIDELLDPCCSHPYTPAKSEQEIREKVLDDNKKPGCFGSYGMRTCDAMQNGCDWISRCRQSQEDY